MNLIEVIGNLGAEPEQRVTPTGKKVTTFRMADSQKKGDREEVIWWRVTIWDNAFERLIPHLKKGSAVSVHGNMRRPDIYKDREGKSQVSLEITAQIIRFIPGNRQEREEGYKPAARLDHQAKSEGGDFDSGNDRPGGFSPGKGRTDYDFGTDDDQVPF